VRPCIVLYKERLFFIVNKRFEPVKRKYNGGGLLTISPNFKSGLDNQFQLGPLVILADFVAVKSIGKSTLKAQAPILRGQVL
jgi:hypothetical protein